MDFEEKLREYMDSSLSYKGEKYSMWRDWAYGAVDFATVSGLIDIDARHRLMIDYKLCD